MLYSFAENGKFGMINKDGEVIVKPTYSILSERVYEGYALGHQNSLWIYIDRFGNQVKHFPFRMALFMEGMAAFKLHNRTGLINKKFEVVVKPRYYHFGLSIFREGLARVATPDESDLRKYGFVNKNGDEVISLQRGFMNDFHEGLAVGYINDTPDGKQGAINQNGEVVIEPIYDSLQDCRDGKLVFNTNQKCGVLNKEGEILIPAIFEEDEDSNSYIKYSDGLLLIYKDNQCTYFDINSQEKTGFLFDNATPFDDGFARVEKNGKWAFINRNFEFITGFHFDDTWSFSEGLAPVKINNKWGFINTSGEIVIEPNYEEVLYFEEGLAKIILNERHGYINSEGGEVFREMQSRAGIDNEEDSLFY